MGWHWDNGSATLKPFDNPMKHMIAFATLRGNRFPRHPARAAEISEFADLKRRASSFYATQTANYTGEAPWGPFSPGCIEKFMDRVVFFSVEK